MIEKLFPKRLHKDVLEVKQALGDNLVCDGMDSSIWRLSDGESVEIPYRLDISANANVNLEKFNQVQRSILSCILTRSHNGYVRQKHIEYLLENDLPEWILPFIIKLGDEYIECILDLIYNGLSQYDDEMIKQFCYNNAKNIIKGYARMTSYWNAYYRGAYADITQYVGYRLYHERLHIDKLLKLR